MRCIIKPIYEVINDYDKLVNGAEKVVVVFATKNKYYYNFPAFKIEIFDVQWGEEGFINNKQCETIKDIAGIETNLLIVACDAGLSRSPAIAAAIYKINGHDVIAEKMMYNYPHLNKDIYAKIVSYCLS